MAPSPLPYPPTPPADRTALAPTGPGSMPQIWSRVAARVLDELVVGIPLGVGLAIWLVVTRPGEALDLDAVPRPAVVMLTVVPLIYEFVALRLAGTTLGKWALGLRVVGVVDGAQPLPYQLGLRVVVVAIGSIVGLAPFPDLVGQLAALVTPVMLVSTIIDPLGRGLHDKAAGTIVLRSR